MGSKLQNTQLGTSRLGYALGAEIEGLDISLNLGSQVYGAINHIWQEHHVVVFRGKHLKPRDIVCFAEGFGDLDDHASTPFYRHPDVPQLLQITNRLIDGKPSETRNTGRNWHSDYSYTGRPAAASLLYCDQCPPVGGDTMFSNMEIAYETLEDDIKKKIEGKKAIHTSLGAAAFVSFFGAAAFTSFFGASTFGAASFFGAVFFAGSLKLSSPIADLIDITFKIEMY